ncbi:prepilin peptidase-dependent protein [Serratia sp. DD3]|uniref:prepilin peptidase-dependent protein n=1 Tax=Serratia sp. DD3 TaxID=1410619 RepID=UPI0003C4F7F9|nr:prepilin peptidase-dependent protein [Serratia sp. DD3]KEY59347.1 hypothetical protein SRDD_16270 [Serratia sp. DD3]
MLLDRMSLGRMLLDRKSLERGFTLPEVMLAMTVGSMITLAAAKALPILRQQTVNVGHHYRLDLLLRQLVFTIDKDLRRSGFCAGECQGRPLLISRVAGEAPASCVIVAYDLNLNGRWEEGGEAEYFGYRLRAGALEGQRGVRHCQGSGWERLLDPQEVQIESFTVRQITRSGGKSFILLGLTGRSSIQETIQSRLEWVVSMEAQ